jgi:hypothetical protein
MGRAFTPNRSAFFGSPERQAASDLGQFATGVLMDLSEEDIAAENDREISNAGIALQAEWDGLQDYMIQNANKPADWPKEFTKRQDKIRKSILKGARQPGAKEVIGLEMNEKLSAWAGEVQNRASVQIAKNANKDFETGINEYLRTYEYGGSAESMQYRLSSAIEHIENGAASGYDATATPELTAEVSKQVARKIIGDYSLQTAAGPEDFDALNGTAKGLGLEGDLFGPDEITDLKKRHKESLVEKQAMTKREYDTAVTAGVNAIQDKLYLKRDFTDSRKFIDENLPAEAVDEREHWYDKAEALAKAELSKEDSPFEKTMNPAKEEELTELAARDGIDLAGIEKWVGKKDGISIAAGQRIKGILEDDAHIFKTQEVKAWFYRLSNDFGKPKDDPVRAADYAEKLRKYFLDYEKANKKLPSSKEVDEFYDKTFVAPGIMKWLTDWATNRIKGFRSPIDRALTADIKQRITDWAAGKEETPPVGGGQKATKTGGTGVTPSDRWILGERFERGGKKYKITGFDPADGMPLVEEIK